jgi:hypothetical protein
MLAFENTSNTSQERRLTEVDTVVRVRENMYIVVFHLGNIKLVEQSESILQMNIVVCSTVHDKEALVAAEGADVGDARVLVAGVVVLGRVHVAFSVDGICNS